MERTKKYLQDIEFCKRVLHFHGHNGIDMKPKECIKMIIEVMEDRLNGIKNSDYKIKVFGFDNLDLTWLKGDFKKLTKLLEYQDCI